MNNWNELNSYAQEKVETRRQAAQEWQLARLAQNHTQETGKATGSRFPISQMFNSLVMRLRAVWLGA
ncbi:MAG: hypothetical protein M3R61_09500 [Chloroflexota bacterium]|nr:hypothetical protein [Chloroflexota bacterium]